VLPKTIVVICPIYGNLICLTLKVSKISEGKLKADDPEETFDVYYFFHLIKLKHQ
jgi:hypothetical protein